MFKEALTYDDVLMPPKRSEPSSIDSRSVDCDVSTTVGKEHLRLPIIASNMDTITGLQMAFEMWKLGGLGIMHRAAEDFATEIPRYWDEWQNHSTGKLALSVGSYKVKREAERLKVILQTVPLDRLILCAEIAHGDSNHMLDTVKFIRDFGFEGTLISGAVCTPEGVERLCEAGADAIRVGIGPGSACTTRIKTGIGYPQFSAVYECSRQTKRDIIADGGIKEPGDAAKALAAGAKAVMLGGMLKGTDKTPMWKGVDQELIYRGMASNDAKTSSGLSSGYEEGISTKIKGLPKGSTKAVIDSIVHGVQSTMSYRNARKLKTLAEEAEFVRVTAACIRENKPHSIM